VSEISLTRIVYKSFVVITRRFLALGKKERMVSVRGSCEQIGS